MVLFKRCKFLTPLSFKWAGERRAGELELSFYLTLLYKLQGTSDGFLANQLKPEAFKSAAAAAGYAPVSVRMQAGYDHSYYFISTFMADHIRYMIMKTYTIEGFHFPMRKRKSKAIP